MTIDIIRRGHLRSTLDIARDFARLQSCGEWPEWRIIEEADSLADLLDAYAAALQPQPAIGSLGDKLGRLHADTIKLLASVSELQELERRRTGSGLRPDAGGVGTGPGLCGEILPSIGPGQRPCGEVVLPIAGTMGFGA